MKKQTTKVAVSTALLTSCRELIEERFPEGAHPDARAGRVSDSALCEIAMVQALKLNTGIYDEMMTAAMYLRVNRIIANHIAHGIAAAVEGGEVREDADGWPEVVARIDGEASDAMPMQREYLKPAARVMN